MQAPQRRIDPPVAERLLREPYRFEFFQAVRLIELMLLKRQERDVHQRLVPGERMVPRWVRFRSSTSLNFPPSEIEALAVRDAVGELMSGAQLCEPPLPHEDAHGLSRIELTPASFGMLGVSGALPIVYTEMLMRREQHLRDSSARAFLDVFSNRAAALFYAAWRKYRLPLHCEHERSRAYLPVLLSMAGLEHTAQRDPLTDGTGTVFDETVAGYAAAVRHRPMSAAYLQRVLSDYFRSHIRIEQFLGKWYDMPVQQRSKLGEGNVSLGQNAMAGERIWQRDLRIRLWIGPLKRSALREFFPGRAHAKALEKMLALLAGVTCEYEVRLILAREEVAAVQLSDSGGSHLGWDSFITTCEAESDRSDTQYELQPLQ
ncbi:type VI secretion system baseplate subunit TssG [Variovorax sp. EBFNA2]|uniref:type VI secretion system baseplate subunit TssG n=1 Tax=Variovorax sp. EBFNA2 TaxID=3342097 RepID=UPI0029BFE834|nr:type VI secretion system baseplate subunit TssG [Variovorax boronicumulans]WPG37505.1 type VI secretion system baseplate subunit TssG [Variovorax boronicumulans]